MPSLSSSHVPPDFVPPDRSTDDPRDAGATANAAWPAALRWSLYALLLVSSFGSMTVRLWLTERPVGESSSPMLSANDRSRWVTVRALAETGSYEIERYTRDTEQGRYWQTIDKVVHAGPDGRMHEYSSKPPLLATMIAGVYWLFYQNGMLDFQSDLFLTVRTLLLLCQILPLTLTLAVWAWQLDRLEGFSDATRLFVLAASCWGTFVPTFAVSLNNHQFAVIAVYWSLIALLQLRHSTTAGCGWFLVLGLGAGFAAANELPALAWTVLVTAVAVWLDPTRGLRFALPALMIVAVAYFGTNLMAHHSLRPPYTYRTDGPVLLSLEPELAAELAPGPLPLELRRHLNRHSDTLGFQLGPTTWLEENRWPLPAGLQQRWVIRDYYQLPNNPWQWRAVALVQPRDQQIWEVRAWENWYDYPGSYWHDGRRAGIDVGEESPWRYALHVLVGHHGLFSLTPLWLLSLLGIGLAIGKGGDWRWWGCGVLLLSLVVIGFYLSRPQLDRNYGGQTSALRWLFWLSPLWLLMLLPAVQWLERFRWGWPLAVALLLASAASALVSGTNPWVHPWLYPYLASP